ncbi:MAG: hypothetical protein GF398_06240 [Chitinivibrionales bacterium]|nr:hypothetical protein [Chitinivibrionales bacterium]
MNYPLLYCLAVAAALYHPVHALNLPGELNSGLSWQTRNPWQEYPGKKLYEFIDGEADIFVAYGFNTCFATTFSATSADTVYEIEIKIYDQQEPLQAFGLFRAIAEYDDKQSGIGTEAVVGNRYLYVYKGKYYLDIADRSQVVLTPDQFTGFAKAVVDKLPAEPRPPKALALLPDSLRIEKSERYHHNSFLARSFLRGFISARYRVGEDDVLGFVSVASDDQSAHQRMFADIQKQMECRSSKSGVLACDDRYFAVSDKRIFGVESTAPQSAKAVLDLLMQ